MVPPATDPRWIQLAKGQTSVSTEFLALKLLLQRAQLGLRLDDSATAASKYGQELQALFTKNEHRLQKEIAALFS